MAAIPGSAASRLTDAELRAVSREGVVKTFPKNAILVNETDSLHIILSGRVKVFLGDGEGTEMMLGTQAPGDYFGERVLDGGPRSASVMTIEPSRFAVIPKARSRNRSWCARTR